jgi:hypothetical protein
VLPSNFMLGGAVGLALLAIKVFIRNPWPRLAIGAFAVGVSLLAGWVFVVASDEKPILTGVLRTFLGQAAS